MQKTLVFNLVYFLFHAAIYHFCFRVGVVTLNRPKALNALCAGLMDELIRCHFHCIFFLLQGFNF